MGAPYFTTPDGCSCPGWKYHRKCRHVAQLRQALAVVEFYRRPWRRLKERKDGDSTREALRDGVSVDSRSS